MSKKKIGFAFTAILCELVSVFVSAIVSVFVSVFE